MFGRVLAAGGLFLLVGVAVAGDQGFSKKHLLPTLECMMVGYRYAAVGSFIRDQAPRDMVAEAAAVYRLPYKSSEEEEKLEEQVIEYMYGNWPLNIEQTAGEKFAACLGGKRIPLNLGRAPSCWSGMMRIEEVVAARRDGVKKDEIMNRVELSAADPAKKAIWDRIVETVYGWDGNPTEISLMEVIRCAR